MVLNNPPFRLARRRDKTRPVPRVRPRRGQPLLLAGQKCSQGLRRRASDVRIRWWTYHAMSSCIAWSEFSGVSANSKDALYWSVSSSISELGSKNWVQVSDRFRRTSRARARLESAAIVILEAIEKTDQVKPSVPGSTMSIKKKQISRNL